MILESLHSLIDLVLPFSWSHYAFMKNALLAMLLLAPVMGIIGTMVVNNKMAFFSDAIGHSTFTGLAIGTILGISDLSLSAIIFSIIFALLITFFRHKAPVSTDTLISVFASIAVAFGIAVMSSGGDFKKYSNYLIGDILSITGSDLINLLTVFILVFVAWYFMFNKLVVLSLSRSLARSQGIRIMFYDAIFTVLVALVITFSIQWIGILLINSLLVLPAATARNLAQNIRQYHFYSVFFAILSGISGLICSYYFNIAAGSNIILVAGAFYLISVSYNHFFLKGSN